MLKAIYRLKKNAEFEAVYQNGVKSKFGPLLITVMPNDLENSRIGIVVSKKVSKLATRRNYLKRLIRAYVGLPQQNFDVVISVLFDPQEKTSEQIRTNLSKWARSL
ncbi:ribonuclease P protein component [Candidatus Berkelbacteria bacterium]|nr:ribonuclease P protein component [Candidatus Berkelbacteria bacterium]